MKTTHNRDDSHKYNVGKKKKKVRECLGPPKVHMLKLL